MSSRWTWILWPRAMPSPSCTPSFFAAYGGEARQSSTFHSSTRTRHHRVCVWRRGRHQGGVPSALTSDSVSWRRTWQLICSASGGTSISLINDGTGRGGANPVVAGSAGVSYAITPVLGIGVGATYRYYSGLYNDLAVTRRFHHRVRPQDPPAGSEGNFQPTAVSGDGTVIVGSFGSRRMGHSIWSWSP